MKIKASFIGLFLSLFVAIISVSSVASYELHMYMSQPVFWIGISISFLGAVFFIFSSNDSVRYLATTLLFVSFLAAVSYPMIRGYYYLGISDSLTHLGEVKNILSSGYTDSRYPIIHIFGTVLTLLVDTQPESAFLLILPVYCSAFLIYIPMLAKTVWGGKCMVVISLLSAALLLPINHIAVHLQPHPTSQAILFSPVLLFSFFYFIRSTSNRSLVIFFVLSIYFTLLHPQQSMNIIILFGFPLSIWAVKNTLGTEKKGGLSTGSLSSALLLSLLFFITSWIHINNLPAFESSFARLIGRLVYGARAGTEIASRSVSASQLGVGLFELFIMLFSISLIYCLLSFYSSMSTVVLSKSRILDMRNPIVFLTWGMVPIFFIFIVYILGNMSVQYFRHLGFIMVIITIIGSFSLKEVSIGVSRRSSSFTPRTILTTLFLVFLVMSLPVLHSSPYILRGSGHVPETQMVGYESVHNHQNQAHPIDYVSSQADRNADGIFVKEKYDSSRHYNHGIEAGFPEGLSERNISEYYDNVTYLVITDRDRKVETGLYDGLRYTTSDFKYVDEERNTSKIYSNSGLDAYYIA